MEDINLKPNSISAKLGLYALKNDNEILFNIALAPNHSEALNLYSDSLNSVLKDNLEASKVDIEAFNALSHITDMILKSSIVVVGSVDIVSHDLVNNYSIIVDNLSTILDSALLDDVLSFLKNNSEVNCDAVDF